MSIIIPANASSFSLNTHKLTLFKGDKTTLEIEGVDSGKVAWSTSNKAVVSVNRNGVITARKAGTAVVTGKYYGITFKCKVTVQNIKKLNKLLYSGKYGRLWLKEINSKGFVFKYKNTTDMVIWLDSQYFILDGKQLEYKDSGMSDPDTGYLIIYNEFQMIVPKGWSKDELMYIEKPSVKSKKFSGFLKVMRYEKSSGYDIGQIVFTDIKLQ
jgi:hypothetical protein